MNKMINTFKINTNIVKPLLNQNIILFGKIPVKNFTRMNMKHFIVKGNIEIITNSLSINIINLQQGQGQLYNMEVDNNKNNNNQHTTNSNTKNYQKEVKIHATEMALS